MPSLVTEQIYRLHPALDEGAMTRMRVALVRRESLAEVAKRLQLGLTCRLDKENESRAECTAPRFWQIVLRRWLAPFT